MVGFYDTTKCESVPTTSFGDWEFRTRKISILYSRVCFLEKPFYSMLVGVLKEVVVLCCPRRVAMLLDLESTRGLEFILT